MSDNHLRRDVVQHSECVGERLKLIEKRTGIKGAEWTRLLDLPPTAWHNWKNGRNPAAALRYAEKIRQTLADRGYVLPAAFLADMSEADLGLALRAPAASIPNHIELDVEHCPFARRGHFGETLKQLEPFGVQDLAPTFGLLVGSNPMVVQSCLADWFEHRSFGPSVPILHFHAPRYEDIVGLLTKIARTLGSDVSAAEAVGCLREHARARRFLLILDGVDQIKEARSYVDRDFRIESSILTALQGEFAYDQRDVKARLLLTARRPLHGVPRNCIVDAPIPPIESRDEIRVQQSWNAQVGEADALEAVVRLGDAFAEDGSLRRANALPSELPGRVTHGDDIAQVDLVRQQVAQMPSAWRVVLRLVAASEDGLRLGTLRAIAHRVPKKSQRSLLTSLMPEEADELEKILSEKLRRVLRQTREPVRDEHEEKFEVCSNALRLLILRDWEGRDVKMARAVYRAIGAIAYERAREEARAKATAWDARRIDRFLQAGLALLASVNPKPDDDEWKQWGRNHKEREAETEKALMSDRDIGTYDCVQFVFRRIFANELEGSGHHLTRRHGEFRRKLEFLIAFKNLGTMLPFESRSELHWSQSHPLLTDDQDWRLRADIAITAAQLCLYSIVAEIASASKSRSAAGHRDDRKARRVIFKALVDSHVRQGHLAEAETSAWHALEDLGHWKQTDPPEVALSRIAPIDNPAGNNSLSIGVAIDFWSRLGEVHLTRGEFHKARIAFQRAEDISLKDEACGRFARENAARDPRWEQRAAEDSIERLCGSNGQRYIDYCVHLGCQGHDDRLGAFGNAIQRLERCKRFAKEKQYEHDLVSLSIEEARLNRLCGNGEHFFIKAIELLKRARTHEQELGVSKLVRLRALAEEAKYRELRALGDDGEGHRLRAQQCARALYEEAHELNAPVFKATALLLLCELNEAETRKYIEEFDDVCDAHEIRLFHHSRSLLVHGIKPTSMRCW